MISDIYVGDDGKLHKTKGGADTVLNFSSSSTFANGAFVGSSNTVIDTGLKNVRLFIVIFGYISTGLYFDGKQVYDDFDNTIINLMDDGKIQVICKNEQVGKNFTWLACN